MTLRQVKGKDIDAYRLAPPFLLLCSDWSTPETLAVTSLMANKKKSCKLIENRISSREVLKVCRTSGTERDRRKSNCAKSAKKGKINMTFELTWCICYCRKVFHSQSGTCESCFTKFDDDEEEPVCTSCGSKEFNGSIHRACFATHAILFIPCVIFSFIVSFFNSIYHPILVRAYSEIFIQEKLYKLQCRVRGLQE